MTGTAVALLERRVAYRIEQSFFRTAMGVMTAVTGIWTWFNVFVGFQEISALHNMAVRAKLAAFFGEHALFIRAVCLVTLQAVFDCRFMYYSLTPILGNLVMTAEADHRLSFFEDMVVG